MSRLAHHHLPRRQAGEHGFTLVELLVVMVLLTVVGGVVTTSVVSGLTASRRGQARVYALTDLEMATQRVAREARAADPIISADGELLDLVAYRNGGRYRFRYELVGDELRETRTWFEQEDAATPTSTLGPRTLIGELDQGGSPIFTFVKQDGSEWITGDPPGEIGRVRIFLRRDLREQDAIEVETAVYVRNTG